ncbi:MAG: hypothetical protein AAFZ65_06655 [Planctomycetota bacterium]
MQMTPRALLGILILSCAACMPARSPEPQPANDPIPNRAPTAPAAADSERPRAPLTGNWRASESTDEQARRLSAIDAATESLGRFQQGMARSRLADNTSPADAISIDLAESRVLLDLDRRRFELPLGGPPVELTEEEQTIRLQAELEGEALRVEARTDSSVRTTTYRPNGDQLLVEVSLTSDKLTVPLEYAVTYRRAE